MYHPSYSCVNFNINIHIIIPCGQFCVYYYYHTDFKLSSAGVKTFQNIDSGDLALHSLRLPDQLKRYSVLIYVYVAVGVLYVNN